MHSIRVALAHKGKALVAVIRYLKRKLELEIRYRSLGSFEPRLISLYASHFLGYNPLTLRRHDETIEIS